MTIAFKINGKEYAVNLATLPATITINTFIREYAQLTATKFMCLEGGCGTCVVAVERKNPRTCKIETFAVNSCLTLLSVCRDWNIVTNEGIGNKLIGYHPIQKRLAELQGTQCGYCSSGFVMNMFALLKSKANKVSMKEVENSFGGNICRCTGYRPILDAFKSFATDNDFQILDIEELNTICPKTDLVCSGKCHKPMIMPELEFDDGVKWYWPKSLKELFSILEKIPADDKYMLVAGNTAHGVYRRPFDIKHFVDINGISALKQYSLEDNKLTLGANLSLTEAMVIFKSASKAAGFEYCQALYDHFDLIANVPVRNMGTLAGNISIKKMHPEFPSDVFILLQALDAAVIVNTSATTKQKISLQKYLKSTTGKHVIMAFELKPYPKDKFVFKSYKIMPRAQNAHAYVNAAFLVLLEPATNTIIDTRICFGGIRPDFVHSTLAESKLKGKVFHDNETITSLFKELPGTFQPDDVLPETSPKYRTLLACSLLYKFLISIAPADKIKSEYRSGGEILKRPLSSGYQEFNTVPKYYPVTKAVPKYEAKIQASGEADYTNDVLTKQPITGFLEFVNATKVGATIEDIDAKEALKVPGVIAFYSAKDIPGTNISYGKYFDVEDEEIFCAGRVKYHSQPLGVIVAKTSDIAHFAASLVRVMYSKPAKVIYTSIEDVLESKQKQRVHLMYKTPLDNFNELKTNADMSGSGVLELGSQYHFFLEPQTTVVVPSENGLQVYCSTQWMDAVHTYIAGALKMGVNDVQLKVLRLGGGFGGKISRGNMVACAAALAAHKLNIPIRFVQRIESMMSSDGKRWACRSYYSFDIKKNGKVVALSNTFYEDAGCTLNENPIIGYTIPISKNCYALDENYKLKGEAVLTDAPSHAYCRAPGSIEGIAMIENIMEHIAFEAKLDPAEVRIINLREDDQMREILPQFLQSTNYYERQKDIDAFNGKNRWRKKGIGLTIMEFPIAYSGQYPATVAIYHADGTVVISHGGIEMGQGMNTKITQVAAFVLNVPLPMIKVVASETVNGANAMLTGGSIGSEMLCSAVQRACTTLNERLKPIKDAMKKDATWPEITNAAYKQSVNLIASDQCKAADLKTYSLHGVGITEVEIDLLTGNLLIQRVDIIEDTGESLSPLIDVGQVEGAFVMGLGYWLSEKLIFNRQNGELLTNSTWTYKPPGAKDIPIDFRIKLSQKYPNTGGFMRSKAIGEPAITLSISAVFAIQHAMQCARKDAGLPREYIRLGAPTTPETILLNCGTKPSDFILQ